jgi:ABC-type tungstate transport system permease subunit
VPSQHARGYRLFDFDGNQLTAMGTGTGTADGTTCDAKILISHPPRGESSDRRWNQNVTRSSSETGT